MRIYNELIHSNRSELGKYIICFALNREDLISIKNYNSLSYKFRDCTYIAFCNETKIIFDFFRISIFPTTIFMLGSQKINEFICHIKTKEIIDNANKFLNV